MAIRPYEKTDTHSGDKFISTIIFMQKPRGLQFLLHAMQHKLKLDK
jgi:hypothetical protein